MIGQEWKCSNAWSGLILIGRKFDQEYRKSKRELDQIRAALVISFEGLEGEPEDQKYPVIIMGRIHLYPCRTQ